MTRANSRIRFGGSKRQTAEGRYQPRPAFGLRPWFALLRRARSLRRFAFAIVSGSVPGESRYRPGNRVILAGDEWRSPDVTVATTFRDRLLGMRRRGTGALLVRASSVHGAGIRRPLRVVHIDASGRVSGQDILTPGRRLSASGLWILELPLGTAGPAPGAALTLLLSMES